MKELKFLYTTDSHYFPHMLTSIYSLLENNKNNNIIIYIIEDGLTIDEIKYLIKLEIIYKNVEIKMYTLDSLELIMSEYNIPKWRNTTIANARLFISELISFDKLMYIDSDTIVSQSLESAFLKKMKNPLAAVKGLTIPSHLRNKLDKYYNSGVLLFDYSSWKKEKCLEKIKQTIEAKEFELIYPDQDLINLTFQDKIDTLSLDYNLHPIYYKYLEHDSLAQKFFNRSEVLSNYDEVKEAVKNPHIYHSLNYIQIRPWEQNKVHPFNDIYAQYRKMWDPTFKPKVELKKISDSSLISYINLLSKAYLSENLYKNISDKVKTKK